MMQLAQPGKPISFITYHREQTSIRNRITLEQHLFNFLLEGEKTVHYAGRTAHIVPGEFLLMSAGNCLMSEKTVAPGGNYKSMLIAVDINVLHEFLLRFPAPDSKAQEQPFLLFKQDDFLRSYIDSLRVLLDRGTSISPAMRQVKLEELLTYLCEHYPGKLQTLQHASSSTGQEMLIRQAVTANVDQPISVEELAFLCHISLSTFKRHFASIYGMPPNKWLLQKRMEKAARLLKEDGKKATEIYLEVGYENLSSFIQSFKQVYGVTPKKFQSAG